MDQEKLTEVLSAVAGVDAIVLGGSKSRGEADPESNTDIGVYYRENMDWKRFEQTLRELTNDFESDKVLFQPDEWGPWVDGGAGLTIAGEPYDIILRDTKKVEAVINECLAGKISVSYQMGHPYGFVSSIYAAEVHYAKLLWENENQPFSHLKELLGFEEKLPPKLKETVIERFLYEAQFSMDTARKAAFKGDMHYVTGCFFRTVSCWNQVLYALNDRYMMNEKASMKAANRFPITPQPYLVRVNQGYRYLTGHHPELGFAEYELLHKDISELIKTHYEK